ncbi:MAG: ABC transporter permease [Dehalococcoidia bacterium]|nr:ABC transporter permease [Dehalococcoidia bacterium]
MSVDAGAGMSLADEIAIQRRRLPRLHRRDLPVYVAVGVVGVVALCAVAAPVLAPHDPAEQDLLFQFGSPSRDHPLGTDDLGRDVLSRLIYGSRVAAQVGLISVGIAILAGVPIGLAAGYAGRWVDTLLMRVMDALLAFPPILLAMAVIAGLGPGIRNAMIAIGIVFMPTYARLARGSALVIKEMDYALAARALGAGPARVVLRHIVPNSLAPILVQASLGIGIAVIAEASLAYLGLGSQPPNPSWGIMLRQASSFLEEHWFASIPPGAAIFVLVLSVNVIGDHLRDVFDPRLRGR